jgi:hypothetical protein
MVDRISRCVSHAFSFDVTRVVTRTGQLPESLAGETASEPARGGRNETARQGAHGQCDAEFSTSDGIPLPKTA